MHEQHLINLAGTDCPPEEDEAFNEHYDEHHIPINLQFEGLKAVARYRRARSSSGADGYPQYLTTWTLKDWPTFEAWHASPEHAAGGEGFRNIWLKQKGVKVVWRGQYQSLRAWQETPALLPIRVEGIVCPPEAEVRFDAWYSEKYIPDVLRFKGLTGVVRYRLVASSQGKAASVETKEYPNYLTFYYFVDLVAAESFEACEERVAAIQDWLDVKRDTGASMLWQATFEPMRTWHR